MHDEDSFLVGGSSKRSSKITLIFTIIALAFLGLLFGLLGWQISMTRSLQRELKNQQQNNIIANSPYTYLQPGISSAMDSSADPCVDFYQYSCGGFLAQYPQALPFMYTPVFTNITMNNLEVLNNIVTDQWPLIGDLYSSCMASDPSDFPGDEFIKSILNINEAYITPINSTQWSEVLPVLAQLHALGSDAFFTPGQMQNLFSDDSFMYLALEQSGSPIFYTNTTIQREYNMTLAVLDALGVVEGLATRALDVLRVEFALFSIYGDAQTYQEYYVNMSVSEFKTLTNISYNSYIEATLGRTLADNETMILSVPSYFAAENLTALLGELTIQQLKDYLAYRTFVSVMTSVLVASEGIISTPDNFEILPSIKLDKFSQKKKSTIVDMEAIYKSILLSDTNSISENQLACINIVNTFLGDFVGLIFTLEVLDQDVINDIHMLTGNIQNAFKNSLSGLDWIDAESQQAAAYKLQNILQIIGHPNFLQRYRGLILSPSLGVTSNILAIRQQVYADQMSVVGQEFNRSNYEFPSTIVNAFYSPPTNTINFPAGILQPPMYSLSYPAMLRYARLGYVIGHETTHGFDNSGRLWSAFGVYSDLGIFDNETGIKFEEQAQCLVNQFDAFTVSPGVHVNGANTLGENIADLGGVKNAYRGYKAWITAQGAATDALDQPSFISGLTNDQLFWVMLGQTWCTVASDAQLQQQVIQDVHSPSKFRINGPLANFDSFAQAFQCPAGSPMNPTNKCLVW
eukprot:TRINITY_DN1545_c0_g2_i2.p1 TRINITY_DN1545_c0_g2~~TRINITY_DN1545_c0_g2_i2.p1  ORF type:complete len:753 (+),score=188.09 TRINITY_DN1545_c0_g2_i2:29-2260(+)